MALHLSITTGVATPIYQQIIEQVTLAVAKGDLQVGEQMPSVRNLAEELVINPNTLARAYAELVRDGVLESHRGKGFFVAKRRTVYTQGERSRRLEADLDSFISQAIGLGCDADEIRRVLDQRLSKLFPDDAGKGGKNER
jgi:GntR family transcriptional regulator